MGCQWIWYLIFLGCIMFCNCDQEDWIDPHDPWQRLSEKTPPSSPSSDPPKDLPKVESGIQRDHEEKKETEGNKCDIKLGSCQKNLNKTKKKLDALTDKLDKQPPLAKPYIQRYVNTLVQKISLPNGVENYHDLHYQIDTKLTPHEFSLLQDFGKTGTTNLQTTMEILENMILIITYIPPTSIMDVLQGIGGVIQQYAPFVIAVCGAVAMCVLAVHVQWRSGMSWYQLIIRLSILSFCVSIPWNWYTLFKEEEAKKVAKSHQDMPKECFAENHGYWKMMLETFTFQDDKCTSYYRNVLIEPWMEVTPLKAVAVTLTKFILEPAEYIGVSLNKLIEHSLKGLPFHLQPFVFAFVMILVILLMIMMFGYKISFFYIFGVEPSRPAVMPAALDNETMHRIMDNMANMEHMIEASQGRLQRQMSALQGSVNESLSATQVPAIQAAHHSPTIHSTPSHHREGVSAPADQVPACAESGAIPVKPPPCSSSKIANTIAKARKDSAKGATADVTKQVSSHTNTLTSPEEDDVSVTEKDTNVEDAGCVGAGDFLTSRVEELDIDEQLDPNENSNTDCNDCDETKNNDTQPESLGPTPM